jgi:hypothetical protein
MLGNLYLSWLSSFRQNSKLLVPSLLHYSIFLKTLLQTLLRRWTIVVEIILFHLAGLQFSLPLCQWSSLRLYLADTVVELWRFSSLYRLRPANLRKKNQGFYTWVLISKLWYAFKSKRLTVSTAGVCRASSSPTRLPPSLFSQHTGENMEDML